MVITRVRAHHQQSILITAISSLVMLFPWVGAPPLSDGNTKSQERGPAPWHQNTALWQEARTPYRRYNRLIASAAARAAFERYSFSSLLLRPWYGGGTGFPEDLLNSFFGTVTNHREVSPDTRRPPPVARHPSPDTRHLIPDTRHRRPTPGTVARRPSPAARRPSPNTRHPSPNARHPSPDACRPSPAARRPGPAGDIRAGSPNAATRP
jgi:hypothetical protein